MKLAVVSLAILFTTIFLPIVSADTNSFNGGSLILEYPETAVPGSEVVITYTLTFEDDTIDQVVLGDMNSPNPSEECKGENTCSGEYTFIMTESPITMRFLGFPERENQDISGTLQLNSEAEFIFQAVPEENPVIVNKIFTIIPSEPQVEVVETTPYLNDEIVDKVNELGIREITKEQYLEEIELGKNLLVTKNIDFIRKDVGNSSDIISVWTIKIEPKEGVKSAKNVYVFEDVPKKGAYTDDEIIGAEPKFTVLRRDPLIMWHFEEVDEPVEITFETDNVGITGAATAITAEEIERASIWQVVLPVLLIPIIGFVLIYFSKYKKK